MAKKQSQSKQSGRGNGFSRRPIRESIKEEKEKKQEEKQEEKQIDSQYAQEKRYLRQRDFILPTETKEFPVVIVGAGGIGSWGAAILAKLGHQDVTIFDPDKVEDHNLPSQFYKDSDRGIAKPTALAKTVKEFTGTSLTWKAKKFDRIDARIIVIAVDSMKERIRLCKNNSKFEWLIDARMGGEQLELYTCRNNKEWQQSLVTPKAVEHDPCTARSIVYNTAVIGGFIAAFIKKIIKGETPPKSVILDLKTFQFICNYHI